MSLAALNSVTRKIDDTKAELSRVNSMEFIPQGVRTGMLSELNNRLRALEEEKQCISYSKDKIRIHLHGDAIESGKIPIRLLAKVLSKFQSFNESIAQVSLGEIATAKGKISQKVLDAVNLNVVVFGEGSFDVYLENADQENSLDSPIVETALLDMFSILECGENTSLLTDQISPYGARFAGHYKDLLTDLMENDIDLELSWIKSDADRRVFNISHKTTKNIIDFLDTVNYVRDTPVLARGKITMIDLRLFKFDMNTDKYGLIKGKSRYETLLTAKENMGSLVEVSLIKSECYTESNRLTKESWYLEKVL